MTDNARIIRTTIHADLSGIHPQETHWVRASGKAWPLIEHTPETRALARARDVNDDLRAVSDAAMTHYTEVIDMPAHAAMRVHTKHSAANIAGFSPDISVPALAGLFIPPQDSDVLELSISRTTTAKLLAFSHPDLINRNPKIAQIIWGLMTDNLALSEMFRSLANLMRALGDPSTTPNSGWAHLDLLSYAADPNVTAPDPNDPTVQVPYPGITSYMLNPNKVYLDASGQAQTALLVAAKNQMSLQGKSWAVEYSAPVSDADAPVTQPSTEAPNDVGSSSQTRQTKTGSAARVDLASTDDWTVALTTTTRQTGLKVTLSDIDPASEKFTVKFADSYLRYLGYYAIFYDENGNKLDLTNWTPDGEDTPSSLTNDIRKTLGWLIEYDDVQFIGYTAGTTTVLGIPTFDGELELTMSMPEGAVAAEFFGAGLGFSGPLPYAKTPLFGGALTVLMDLVVPIIELMSAASDLENATTKAEVRKLLNGQWKSAVGWLCYYLGDFLYELIHDKTVDWVKLVDAAKVLFAPISFELLLFLEAKMLAEEAAEEVPFAGWVLFALQASVGIATLMETIVELLETPLTIPVGLTTTITSTVNVYPDPRASGAYPYPSEDATLSVTMSYKAVTPADEPSAMYGARSAVVASQTVPANHSGSDTLQAIFPNNTLGGQIKLDVKYLVEGWAAAQATSGWIENTEENAATITLYLIENPIPLDENSIYAQTDLLVYKSDVYAFQTTDQNPTTTIGSAVGSSTGNYISAWRGLTLSQRYGALGYAWKAAGMGIEPCTGNTSGQLGAMQNINIPGTDMDGVAFPSCGFVGPNAILYDPYPPKFEMQDGNWVMNDATNPPTPVPDPTDQALGDYYLDPRQSALTIAEGGGYHLRKVDLTGNQDPDQGVSFDMSPDQLSYGRYSTYPTQLAMHPAGYVIGVDAQNCKISVLKLTEAGANDNIAAVATDYAGSALIEERVGLLFRPIGVTCSYDGTILVLENTKGETTNIADIPAVARIQAFDVTGNSVACFKDSSGKDTAFLPLDGVGDYTYLDICAVGDQQLAYIFVLYYTDNGHDPSEYYMAIYQYGEKSTNENPLVTTDGMAAAALFVDMWHQLYTLNYAMTTDGDGNSAGPISDGTGPAGRTVPAVGQWLPPFPSS